MRFTEIESPYFDPISRSFLQDPGFHGLLCTKVNKHVASRTISMFSETERREEKRPDIAIPLTCIIENPKLKSYTWVHYQSHVILNLGAL